VKKEALEAEERERIERLQRLERERKRQKPCFKWRDGACTWGDKCMYNHDPKVRISNYLELWVLD